MKDDKTELEKLINELNLELRLSDEEREEVKNLKKLLTDRMERCNK